MTSLWICYIIIMDSWKQIPHSEKNSGALTSIARDRQFGYVSEIVHRSRQISQFQQNGSDLFCQQKSDSTLIETNNLVAEDRKQAQNMFRRFLILFMTQWRHYFCTLREIIFMNITAVQYAKKQVRFELELRIHDVPIEDITGDYSDLND